MFPISCARSQRGESMPEDKRQDRGDERQDCTEEESRARQDPVPQEAAIML